MDGRQRYPFHTALMAHISKFIYIPFGGIPIASSWIFTCTYFSLLSVSCRFSCCSLLFWARGISGLSSSSLPSGLRFFLLGFPQNSMHVDILQLQCSIPIFYFQLLPMIQIYKKGQPVPEYKLGNKKCSYHWQWLKALILLSMSSSILLSSPSQMLFCFSMATMRSNLWMQDLSTCLLISSGFLLDTMVTRDRVNSSFPNRVSKALPWSRPFSARKFCNFLLWLKMVVMISFTSSSLLALELVAIDVTVSVYFCEDRGLLLMEDLGFICFKLLSDSPSSCDLSLSKGLELSLCCRVFLLRLSFYFFFISSDTFDTDEVCFMPSILFLFQTHYSAHYRYAPCRVGFPSCLYPCNQFYSRRSRAARPK